MTHKSNAIRTMDSAYDRNQRQPRADLEPSRKGAILEITVSDTGSGIAEADLPRIFTPFFTTKGDRGTGLGLYISRKIIEEHHGEITVQTNSGGTTFIVSLPVEP
jgi:signal transduction histidine kinase